MFSSLGLFSKIICPFDDNCELTACIFQHSNPAQHAWLNIENDYAVQTSAKRRKLSPETIKSKVAEPTPLQEFKPQAFVGSLITKATTPKVGAPSGEHEDTPPEAGNEVTNTTNSKIVSTSRPISPPPIRRIARPPQHLAQTRNGVRPEKPQESLNPRMIKNDPAGHATRTLYLKKLHEGMARLNNETRSSSDPATKSLGMTDGQLITLALDEEAKIATDNPAVYANVIKLRMVAYKKMTLDQWNMARLEARVKAEAPVPDAVTTASPNKIISRIIETGLSKSEEVQILSHLVAKQQGLEKYGFVVTPPNEQEIKDAIEGVETSQGWEKCERCTTRFQVFPDRREDGALTSGGKCTYHHGRVTFPDRDRDLVGGRKERYYSCCNESVGITAGCTTGDSHVFKVYDGKRLASILQYEKTPNNPSVADDQAVAFDCEMGFTVNGMELIRLTAISWPSGEEILDVLVRPLGAILDLNSRYSGVRPEDFLEALPYNATASPNSSAKRAKGITGVKPVNGKTLPPIVDSPMAARSLLFSFLSPSTPLIGHAIENDLNTTRIVHPCIIDTVLLYPHPSGLPRRRALKALTKQMLGRDIQIGGSIGHDSKEDAIATGDLVRVKVGHKWREMQREGWQRQEGRFVPPKAGFKPVVIIPKPQVEEAPSRKRPVAELGEGLGYD